MRQSLLTILFIFISIFIAPTLLQASQTIKATDEIERLVDKLLKDLSTHTLPNPKKSKGYAHYIQLSAFIKEKPIHLLKTLEQAGYHPTILTKHQKGKTIHKVVIGPIKTKEKAKRELQKIKKIAKEAFLTKLRP